MVCVGHESLTFALLWRALLSWLVWLLIRTALFASFCVVERLEGLLVERIENSTSGSAILVTAECSHLVEVDL